jgi:hypothetical protein
MGTAAQIHLVEVALAVHASEGVASLEIQKLHDIVGLPHLPMHPMVFHEAIRAICAQHLLEATCGDVASP